MKSRWWIAASFLVALTLLLQPGCDNAAELPSESSPSEVLEDPADDMVMPEAEGAETPAATPAETPAEEPAE